MLELKDFEAAADRLKNVIHNIPLSTSCTFSAMTGAEVCLKKVRKPAEDRLL